MSDMKKKIGKTSLGGLVNIPKPKPAPAPTVKRGDWATRGGLWDDDDDWKSPTQSFYSAAKGTRANSPVDFVLSGDKALVSEGEMRRIKLEITNQVINALTYRNVIVSITGETLLNDMIDELLWTECKAKDKLKPGCVMYPFIDEVTGVNPWFDGDNDDEVSDE